ncbi:hypothetical protein [Qipengyuania psychrotolerans]|uniref:DUF4345 domain-containing protein n=1 Tax=Qipengyuania psychrotolerans TaxID=2867238 RepID=A0ABX8ZGU6_9SPHN|nr:hypothetical protein [Qipengyuania psychrotolerans]QZD86752.1 hypothetical protein K3166_11165 [Qipengyuania psychrotolerans]
MNFILAALIALGAMLDLVLGVSFFVDPALAGMDFGMTATGPMGLSAMRGDFTAFFLVAAVFMGWGAWKRRSDVLLAPLLLFATAFTGRLVNLFAVGFYEGWWTPMLVEAAHVFVLTFAMLRWRSQAA